MVSSIHNKLISHQIIICAIILGFGGFSVFLQVLSIASKSDLSIKTYLYGKFSQGIVAGIYTYFAIKLIPAFNLDLKTSSFASNNLSKNFFNFIPINYLIIFTICILLFCILKKIINTYLKSKINTIN